jgi:hypothetical protein
VHRFAAPLCVGAALVTAGCAGDGDGTGVGSNAETATRTTVITGTATVSQEEDQRRAANAVLTLADLPEREWERDKPSDDPIVADEISCFSLRDFSGRATAEVEGDALAIGESTLIIAGKAFVRRTHVVSSSVSVYETEPAAETAFYGALQSFEFQAIADCLERAEEVTKGPEVAGVEIKRYLENAFPATGEEARGLTYKIRIKQDRRTNVFLDVVLVRKARTVALMFFSSLESRGLFRPFSFEFVQRTSKIVGDRLGP